MYLEKLFGDFNLKDDNKMLFFCNIQDYIL